MSIQNNAGDGAMSNQQVGGNVHGDVSGGDKVGRDKVATVPGESGGISKTVIAGLFVLLAAIATGVFGMYQGWFTEQEKQQERIEREPS